MPAPERSGGEVTGDVDTDSTGSALAGSGGTGSALAGSVGNVASTGGANAGGTGGTVASTGRRRLLRCEYGPLPFAELRQHQ